MNEINATRKRSSPLKKRPFTAHHAHVSKDVSGERWEAVSDGFVNEFLEPGSICKSNPTFWNAV